MIEMTEFDDRWTARGKDAQVTSLCVDWSVRLAVGAEGPPLEIRVESRLLFSSREDGLIELDPDGNPADLAPLLRIVRSPLDRVDAFKDGSLEVVLADGQSISVAKSEEFEPWEIVSADGFHVVSLPGGGLGTWSTAAG